MPPSPPAHAHLPGAVMVAKFRGRCAACRANILPGDALLYRPATETERATYAAAHPTHARSLPMRNPSTPPITVGVTLTYRETELILHLAGRLDTLPGGLALYHEEMRSLHPRGLITLGVGIPWTTCLADRPPFQLPPWLTQARGNKLDTRFLDDLEAAWLAAQVQHRCGLCEVATVDKAGDECGDCMDSREADLRRET